MDPTHASRHQTTPNLSDTKLGMLYKQGFFGSGPLYFVPSLLMPLLTVFATLGAVSEFEKSAAAKVIFATTTIWYAFGYIPIMDALFGQDLEEEEEDEDFLKKRADDDDTSTKIKNKTRPPRSVFYHTILYFYVPLHLFCLAYVAHLLCTSLDHINTATFIAITVGSGVSNGILFTVAHELLHRTKRIDKFLASILLTAVCYNHWQVSHLQHHVKVGTPEDPSTARLNESIYKFIPRSILGNLIDGYSVEYARIKRNNISFLSFNNRMIIWIGSPLIVSLAMTYLYGIHGLAFFLGQAIGGILMLELVNYIEHYGLERKKNIDGKGYERVNVMHSWNATTFFSNSISFRLQRHSSHHVDSSTPYYLLKNAPEAPLLPAGYAAMLMLSVYPPVFFRVMNKRLDEFHKRTM